jgi:Protein of unknown function (DUF1553)/Protein of unknown function (DUF1549)/Planctomycete cytochrome C
MKPAYWIGLWATLCVLPAFGQSPPTADDITFFEQKVRPLLAERCYSCHSQEAKNLKGGLHLDAQNLIVAGGDSGPAVVVGQADQSLLIQAIRYEDTATAMPPDGKLSDREISILEDWVNRGVPFPLHEQTERVQKKIDIEEGRNHWAFVKLKAVPPPPVTQTEWPQRRIDHFVLAELERKGFSPSRAATHRALLRRAKFDLLGLPPTMEEIDEFETDESPDAYERRIAAWLDSPRYGERWSRAWLELARYCDVMEDWAETLGNGYLYRDWVIQALNQDVPYDRFVQLQLAADQMPDSLPTDVAALGFIGLSPSYWKELQLPVDIIKSIVSDEIEERVHTVSSTFLGLNLACARCHDHKFDPVTAEDYYALAGVLANTKTCDRALAANVDSAKVYEARKLVKKLEAELKPLEATKSEENDKKIAELNSKIAEAKSTPGYDAPLVPGVSDARLVVLNAEGTHGSRIVYEETMKDADLEIRGNPNKPGQSVPRRFVSVLAKEQPTRFSQGSGRLELARSMTEDASALVARVMVNRIWKQHFGVGLVDTPSDFGRQGQLPSHPELLDDLAFRFIDNGWSIKWLHREILLSATYQQSSGPPSQHDPDCRLYSQFPRQRVSVEGWRDSMLNAAGNLDNAIGGPPLDLNQSSNHRRTIYGIVKRRELNDLLRLFDFPDPLTHAPNRIPTTTPLQQLFTLNSDLIMAQSQALAERLTREAGSDDARRIQRAYQLVFARLPSAQELQAGLEFVHENSPDTWVQYAQVLLGSNEFLFVE